jgi:hypothetical protein
VPLHPCRGTTHEIVQKGKNRCNDGASHGDDDQVHPPGQSTPEAEEAEQLRRIAAFFSERSSKSLLFFNLLPYFNHQPPAYQD